MQFIQRKSPKRPQQIATLMPKTSAAWQASCAELDAHTEPTSDLLARATAVSVETVRFVGALRPAGTA